MNQLFISSWRHPVIQSNMHSLPRLLSSAFTGILINVEWLLVQKVPKEKKRFRFEIWVRTGVSNRVARWYIFNPKILIWVNFGGSCNGRCWYILWPFGQFYGHLVYFRALWYILWPFSKISPFLVCCTTKNLATLVPKVQHLASAPIYPPP
jgi:hypothetical protein